MQVGRLTPAHAAEYRALMLRAYAEQPEAFTSTVAERERLPLELWVSRVSADPEPTELVFGAFVDQRLIGVAGLRRHRRERTEHKATLFGMFVRSGWTGRGVGRALVEVVLEHARASPGLLVVQLTVAETNARARHLYETCGFRPFGTEPFANRHGERFVSLVHMWCPVGNEGEPATGGDG